MQQISAHLLAKAANLATVFELFWIFSLRHAAAADVVE